MLKCIEILLICITTGILRIKYVSLSTFVGNAHFKTDTFMKIPEMFLSDNNIWDLKLAFALFILDYWETSS